MNSPCITQPSSSNNPLPAIPIKIEPDTSIDEDMIHEDLAFNSDQDDAGSKIWDFTDEDFNESNCDNSENSDIECYNHKKQHEIHENNKKNNTFLDDFDKDNLEDVFEAEKPTKNQIEDEKTLNTIFFQSIDWRKINNDFPYAIPGVKDFCGKDGVQIPELLDEKDPYNFFTEFLGDDFLELVANYTNQNAALDPRFKTSLKRKPWKTVDKDDIRRFFGLLFLFGLMKKPNIPSYWSQDPLISTECMNRIMDKTFFSRIKRYICFYDKTQPKPVGDSFYKIRSFQDHVLKNSTRVYIPERDLSVDESIILYTGLHRLKVYMPQKPNRYGFKAFVLAEASTGYICNMMMSEGRLKGHTEESFTKRLVLDIMKDYENQGYRVYMDRYYTSAELFMELKRKGIGACGTSLLNRLKLEKALLKDILEFKENDQSIFLTNDSLMMTVFYHYKRQVHMISNFHDNSLTKVEKVRKMRGFDKKDVQVYNFNTPTMIRDYQFKMKGVDLFNQRMSYYSTNFRSLRWYFRIIYFYMEMAMINSYLVYIKVQNANNLRPKSHADYRIYIIKQMVNWKGPERMEARINDFQREQYHMNPQDGARKNYMPSIYDSKKLTYNDSVIDLPCEIDRAKLSGICYYCKNRDPEQNEESFNDKKKKRTFSICKSCKKYCCKGLCFLKHKVSLMLQTLTKNQKATDFINALLSTRKLRIFDNGEEVHKLQNIDLEEFQKKKQAIMQYKRSSLISNEPLEGESEKSITIDNIEEIQQRKDELLSIESVNYEAQSTKKKKRRNKIELEYKNEINQINKLFPKRRGRPPTSLQKDKKKKKDSDEEYEDEEFDKALKKSIKRKADPTKGPSALFSNIKELFGLRSEAKTKSHERDRDDLIYDDHESKNPEQQDDNAPVFHAIKQPLINIKKLYRYDPENQALKVFKSKLVKEKGKKPQSQSQSPLHSQKKTSKSRIVPFLLMDLYKSNELKAMMKQKNSNKVVDFFPIFSNHYSRNTEVPEKFDLVKVIKDENLTSVKKSKKYSSGNSSSNEDENEYFRRKIKNSKKKENFLKETDSKIKKKKVLFEESSSEEKAFQKKGEKYDSHRKKQKFDYHASHHQKVILERKKQLVAHKNYNYEKKRTLEEENFDNEYKNYLGKKRRLDEFLNRSPTRKSDSSEHLKENTKKKKKDTGNYSWTPHRTVLVNERNHQNKRFVPKNKRTPEKRKNEIDVCIELELDSNKSMREEIDETSSHNHDVNYRKKIKNDNSEKRNSNKLNMFDYNIQEKIYNKEPIDKKKELENNQIYKKYNEKSQKNIGSKDNNERKIMETIKSKYIEGKITENIQLNNQIDNENDFFDNKQNYIDFIDITKEKPSSLEVIEIEDDAPAGKGIWLEEGNNDQFNFNIDFEKELE